MKFLLKCLLWKRKLKVLKDQESDKNTTVQILCKEDLKKTKMVREQISFINEKKKKGANKESSKNKSDINNFFFCDLCRFKCRKKKYFKEA